MRPSPLLACLTTIALAVTSATAVVPADLPVAPPLPGPPGLPGLPGLPVEPPGLPAPPAPPYAPGEALPVIPGLNADYLDSRDSTSFADRVHDHDERYYTEAESDARFAAIGHDHDQRYLGIHAKARDSDRLDGLDSSQFLRSDTDGTLRGRLTMVGGGPVLRLHNSDDGGQWWLRHNSGSSTFVIGNTPDTSDANIKLILNGAGDLTVRGHVFAHSSSHVGDVAEPVLGAGLEPGDVVVLDGFDPLGKLRVRKADAPRSPAVVGVVSTDPSLRLAGLPQDTPLAVAGIVPAKVAGPVAAGDLLVSSAVPGHAVPCGEPAGCAGAVLGKALEAHGGPGPGKVRVLVALA